MIRCMIYLTLLLGIFNRCKAKEELDLSAAGVAVPDVNQRRLIRGGEDVAVPDFNQRRLIRGGEDAPNRVPWFVHFEENNLCGGALVYEDIVITTASCVTRERVPTQVRVGAKGRYDGGKVINVATVRIHPDWNGDVVAGNDIAVLKLSNTIGNTLAIMNTDGNITETAKLYALGFGLLDNKELPKGLQQLFYDYVPLCEERFDLYNPNAHLCADAAPTRGVCDGDQGGPVVLSGTTIVVGLASFSDNECESQTYDVFTRMSTYQPFVQNAICDLARNKPSSPGPCDAAPCLFFSWVNFQRWQQRAQQFFGF